MAENLPDLIARLRLDTTEMEDGVGKAAAIGGAIGGALGAFAVAGISKAADAVTDFVSGSVSAFSELEDSTAAAGVVFGDAMGTIVAQAQAGAGSLGLSSQQVINAANTFGTYGKAAGLVGEDLAGFSTQLTSLSGDLASFKGTSTEQAIEAVGAALRGEMEPIRAYGVLLDDATLKSEAMAMGLISNTNDALSPQNKVLAAQAAILKQTTDAQGDFARTSESTANVQKTLAAETDNLQAKFGTLLAPAFTAARSSGIDMVRGLSAGIDEWGPKLQGFVDKTTAGVAGVKSILLDGDFTSAFATAFNVEEDSPLVNALFTIRETVQSVVAAAGPALSSFGSTLMGTFSTIGPQVLDAIRPLGDVFAAVLPAVMDLVPGVLQLVSAFSPLGLVMDVLLPVLPVLVGALSTVAGTVVEAAVAILPALLSISSVITGALVSAITTLAPVVADLAVMLAGVLGDAIVQLAPIITALVPVVAQVASVLAGVLASVIGALAPVIAQLAQVLVALLPPILAIIEPILGVVTALLPLVGIVGDLIATLLPPLLDLFMAILVPVAELAGVLVTALAPVLELVSGIIGNLLVPLLGVLVGWLASLIGWLLRLAGPVLGALVGVLGAVIGWVARVIAAIADWFAHLDRVGDGIARFVNTVSSGIGQVVAWFGRLPGMALSAISGLAGSLVSAGADMISGFIRGIGSMAGRLIAAIRETITDKLPDFVKKALGIASPSRVFRALGRFTGEGFAQGLEASTAGVTAAAQNMVDGVAGVNVAPPTLQAALYGPNAPGAALSAQGAPAGAPAVNVRVYIGETELTDLVDLRVDVKLDEEATAISMGSV